MTSTIFLFISILTPEPEDQKTDPSQLCAEDNCRYGYSGNVFPTLQARSATDLSGQAFELWRSHQKTESFIRHGTNTTLLSGQIEHPEFSLMLGS